MVREGGVCGAEFVERLVLSVEDACVGDELG